MARVTLDCLVGEASRRGLITEGQNKFLTSCIRSDVVALFCMDVKIYKTAMESRPIGNMRGYMLGPAASFLNVALLPIQSSLCSAAISTFDVVQNFEHDQLTETECFITFDVTSLSPNLNADDPESGVKGIVARAIREHYISQGRGAFGNFVCQLLKLVLAEPLIRAAYFDCIFRQR